MATINDIGIPNLGTGILQPKLSNRWRVTFAGIGGGADSNPISVQAIAIKRPKLKFEKVDLHRYNSIAYVASKHSWDPINMTIQDDVSSTASNVIQKQITKQQWLIGSEGQFLATAADAASYKFATTIEMLDGNDQVLESWIVEGCWFDDIDYGDLKYEDGKAMEITISMVYDHARQVIGSVKDVNGLATGGGKQ